MLGLASRFSMPSTAFSCSESFHSLSWTEAKAMSGRIVVSINRGCIAACRYEYPDLMMRRFNKIRVFWEKGCSCCKSWFESW